MFNYIGSQLIIDTHVEESSTLCGEECTSNSLLFLRLEIHEHMYTSIVIVLGNIDNLVGWCNIQKYHGTTSHNVTCMVPFYKNICMH